MVEIGRLITAMITPFDEKGDVNYNEAKRLALALVDSGSDGLVVTGTTGESPVLSTEEKLRLYSEIKQAVGDRAAVIAGATDNNTAKTAARARRLSRSFGLSPGKSLKGRTWSRASTRIRSHLTPCPTSSLFWTTATPTRR